MKQKKDHAQTQSSRLKKKKHVAPQNNGKHSKPIKNTARQIKNNSKKIKKKHPLRRLFVFSFIIVFISTTLYIFYKLYTFSNLAKEMFNNEPSSIYNSNNNLLGQIGAERIRENLSLSSIPNNLINACIAIEDQRYYSHFGVDFKRTAGAIFTYITKGGKSSFGGSTITQQLVKNLSTDDSNSVKRKIKEWGYAIGLNYFFSKDEILNAYLNIIYTGPNIYGVRCSFKILF